MTKWEIHILLDDKPHVLIIDAHSARAALAHLSRHRAAGARNPALQCNYAAADGSSMPIRWGRAGRVTVIAVTASGPWSPLAPAA
jgi:hypothetical protein